MDREFLLDYQQKELEYIKIFHNKVHEGKFDINDRFPPKTRFIKLQEPIAKNAIYESIWSQIPLFGSTIVCLQPCKEFEFNHVYGFEIKDIEKLVDWAKDTGKIQFALGAPAQTFANLDYFDPIFQELNPPCLDPIPLQALAEKEKIKQYLVEFYTLADINFREWIYNIGTDRGYTFEYMTKILQDYAWDYIVLKSIDYVEIIDKIEEALLCNPEEANMLFEIYGTYLMVPQLCSLRAIETYGYNEIKNIIDNMKKYSVDVNELNLDKYNFPCEIGKFLMNKLIPIPEGFESCKYMVGKYKQGELYKILNALNVGVKEKKYDLINNSVDELSVILDNIWDESNRIKKHARLTKIAMVIEIAIMGEIASSAIGGGIGFLTKLGFNTLGQYVDEKLQISSRLAKYGNPNYLSVLYDFKHTNLK